MSCLAYYGRNYRVLKTVSNCWQVRASAVSNAGDESICKWVARLFIADDGQNRVDQGNV